VVETVIDPEVERIKNVWKQNYEKMSRTPFVLKYSLMNNLRQPPTTARYVWWQAWRNFYGERDIEDGRILDFDEWEEAWGFNGEKVFKYSTPRNTWDAGSWVIIIRKYQWDPRKSAAIIPFLGLWQYVFGANVLPHVCRSSFDWSAAKGKPLKAFTAITPG